MGTGNVETKKYNAVINFAGDRENVEPEGPRTAEYTVKIDFDAAMYDMYTGIPLGGSIHINLFNMYGEPISAFNVAHAADDAENGGIIVSLGA